MKTDLGQRLIGNLEEIGGPARDPGEEREDRERHRRHCRLPCAANHDFVGDVIVHLLKIDFEAELLAILQRPPERPASA